MLALLSLAVDISTQHRNASVLLLSPSLRQCPRCSWVTGCAKGLTCSTKGHLCSIRILSSCHQCCWSLFGCAVAVQPSGHLAPAHWTSASIYWSSALRGSPTRLSISRACVQSWQPCPLDLTAVTVTASGDFLQTWVSALSPHWGASAWFVTYLLSSPQTALAHLHQSNSRITPSTQTVTELLVKSASRLIVGSGQYFFSVKNCLTPALRQYPK